jgi:hypothetical protein
MSNLLDILKLDLSGLKLKEFLQIVLDPKLLHKSNNKNLYNNKNLKVQDVVYSEKQPYIKN